MNRFAIAGFLTISAGALTASAAPTIYAAKSAGTTTVLHGGDRELTSLAFSGTSSTMTGADFLRWNSGSLTNNAGTFGWTDLVPRDVNSANVYTGNPDRSDASTTGGRARRAVRCCSRSCSPRWVRRAAIARRLTLRSTPHAARRSAQTPRATPASTPPSGSKTACCKPPAARCPPSAGSSG